MGQGGREHADQDLDVLGSMVVHDAGRHVRTIGKPNQSAATDTVDLRCAGGTGSCSDSDSGSSPATCAASDPATADLPAP